MSKIKTKRLARVRTWGAALSIGLASVMASGVANAALLFQLDPGNSNVSFSNVVSTGSGTIIHNVVLPSAPFSLDTVTNPDTTLDFFTWDINVNADITADITATIAFVAPVVTGGATGTGTNSLDPTLGLYKYTVMGVLDVGGISWDASSQPLTVNSDAGDVFEIHFEDTSDMTMVGGVLSDTQRVNFTLLSVATTAGGVPEPSIIALFGAGLFGIGLVRRRRSRS